MRSPWPLLAALLALLAPGAWCALALAPALAGHASPAGVAGLGLLALSRPLGDPPSVPSPVPSPVPGRAAPPAADGQGGPSPGPAIRAVRLHGVWRQELGGVPWLQTARGRVALQTAADIDAPPPGAPVTVLARVDDRLRARVVHLEVTGPPSGAWRDRAGRAVGARLERLVRGPTRALLAALLLGDRRGLDGAVRDDVRRTGTSHLLALSGLHVGLLGGLLSPWAGRWGTPLLLAAFVALVGGRVPLLRALAMSWAGAAFLRSGRRVEPLAGLLTVALGMAVLLGPRTLDSLSARLSFLAVGGLVTGLAAGPRWARPFTGPAGAVLATAPLCAHTFGEFQPWGLLVTPLAVPLLAALLALGVLGVFSFGALSFCEPALTSALDAVGWCLLAGWEWSADRLPRPWCPPPLPVDPLLAGLAILWALNQLGETRRMGSATP